MSSQKYLTIVSRSDVASMKIVVSFEIPSGRSATKVEGCKFSVYNLSLLITVSPVLPGYCVHNRNWIDKYRFKSTTPTATRLWNIETKWGCTQ